MASMLTASAVMQAQSPHSFVYVESFRKGSTRVQEQILQVDLDPKNPTCSIKVKDQNGRSRYLLGCAPQHSGPGDNRIIAWYIKLADLTHRIYPNVLMSLPDPEKDQIQIGWLDPSKFAKIALTTERVVKVDNFYCVFQVKDSHFASSGEPYLDHMVLAVHFTNTMPHTRVRVKQNKETS